MKRLFLAVKIVPNQEFLNSYFHLKENLVNEKITWVQPDLLHLTIKFFGDTYDERINIVSSVINDTLKEKSSFDFDISGAGVFGSRYKPTTIWFGIRNNDYLNQVANELLNNLDYKGFERGRQNFVPHITIGRIRNIQRKNELRNVVEKMKDKHIQTISVDRLLLYESTLTRNGPVYNIIDRYNLEH